jgi:hypothetical protein
MTRTEERFQAAVARPVALSGTPDAEARGATSAPALAGVTLAAAVVLPVRLVASWMGGPARGLMG